METLYRKAILNIVDRCFHMYASDYRKEAKESAIEMLEEIPDNTQPQPTEKLPSELLREYFKNTPREQVLKDWESTAHLDDVNSPKVSELFEDEEEENNGWIKIQSEKDLPIKNIDCFCLSKNGDILICNSRQTHFWCSDNKWLYNFKDFTHYQSIEKPKPPIY